ncbi:hypothetical protein ACFQQB_25910 [Nonomuraea rubra]
MAELPAVAEVPEGLRLGAYGRGVVDGGGSGTAEVVARSPAGGAEPAVR